jgi:uncharacterized membrane protein YphA (DoxX/SURF4 family)
MGPKAQAAALTIIRITTGMYFFFLGLGKISWLFNSAPLVSQLSTWLSQSSVLSRWYLERVLPGAPLFARLLPLGEMAAGLALAVGFWTRLAATVAFVIVLNVQFASGEMFHYGYLSAARGLPVLGSLLALGIGGGRLPLSLRK